MTRQAEVNVEKRSQTKKGQKISKERLKEKQKND